MNKYEVYKMIHLVAIFLFVGAIAVQFSQKETSKGMKIFSGVMSFLIFLGGMGLLVAIGVKHGEPWPLWVKAKVGLFVLVAALGPILSKRLKEKRMVGYGVVMALIVAAAYTAITKLG